MKKIFLFSCFISITIITFSQADSNALAPYQRFPSIPPFNLLKVDSSSYFTKNDLKKNKPVLIILFSPDCDYCQHETEEIIKNMDQLKNVQILMSTNMAFEMMKSFYEKYDLQRFENITVGRDFQYILPSFYQIRFMPYLAMYDKKGNLLTTFQGSMKIEDLVKVFK
jgi:thioredoxin-related protein